MTVHSFICKYWIILAEKHQKVYSVFAESRTFNNEYDSYTG